MVVKKRVRKVTKKKSVKRKVSRTRRIVKKRVTHKGKIKEEFNDFAKGIERLESLRAELNSLDTTGFNPEVRMIKSKLRDIGAIPQIVRELNSLKGKIEVGKVRQKTVNPRVLKQSKKLRKESEVLKRKISKIERKIDKKKLSPNQKKHIKQIPKLDAELKNLRSKFTRHTKNMKVKIDSGVGVLVDTRFDDFIMNIKGELTKRIKEKEFSMDAQLKADIQSREKLLSSRYSDLVKEFHNKYKAKVHEDLKREVRKNFNDMLNKKLNSEERKLVDKLIKENIRRLSSERKRMINGLQSRYASKVEKDNARFAKEISVAKKEMHDELISKNNKLEREHGKKIREELGKKEDVLRRQLEKEYKARFNEEVSKHERALEAKKAMLERNITEKAKQILRL
tara:strand:- start:390 stop:1577 length:1188 start_codon:yes stop_codon:yes gene_type:complete